MQVYPLKMNYLYERVNQIEKTMKIRNITEKDLNSKRSVQEYLSLKDDPNVLESLNQRKKTLVAKDDDDDPFQNQEKIPKNKKEIEAMNKAQKQYWQNLHEITKQNNERRKVLNVSEMAASRIDHVQENIKLAFKSKHIHDIKVFANSFRKEEAIQKIQQFRHEGDQKLVNTCKMQLGKWNDFRERRYEV